MGYIRNAILIDAPVEEVFLITNNVRIWPDLFTEYESSEVIEESEESVTFHLTTRVDEDGNQWDWIAKRDTNKAHRSTYSERQPSSGPFARMVIRWWYDKVNTNQTVMTWEQEFTLKPGAPVKEEQATAYLNHQTAIQQAVIKEKVELQVGNPKPVEVDNADHYRGLIIGRYTPNGEEAIAKAFAASDQTELPQHLKVKSRHIWVLGDIYVHFVEGQTALPTIIKDSHDERLFQEVKAAVDVYVKPLSPDLNPGIAREIYRWINPQPAQNHQASIDVPSYA